MTRFVCAGDLHLGQRPDLSADRLGDQEEVWDWILSYAENVEADAVLFAGDAFEGPLTTPEQVEAFIGPIERHDMPVYAITGNGRHDSAMRSSTALDSLRHVPNLRVASKPHWVQFGSSGVKLAMLPWASATQVRSQFREHTGDDIGGDLNAYVADVVVSAAAGARADGCNVLLTHFSMSGSSLPNGLPVDQLGEPVIDYAALEEQGWDAIVCGHIHRPQILGERGFYVGSPMPLNFGEPGKHGLWVLEVGAEPRVSSTTSVLAIRLAFVAVPSRPVITHEWDLTKPGPERALGELEPVQDAVVRVVYTAAEDMPIDQSEIRRMLLEEGAHRVFFKPTILRANRARVETVTDLMSDEEALGAWLEAQGIASPEGDALMDAHRTMNGRLT